MIVSVLVTGAFHFFLVWRFNISAVGATLATYIAIQGLSLYFRPSPAGIVDERIINIVTYQVGWVPVVAILAFAIGLALEWWLRFSRLGTETRALGSNETIAGVLGVRATLAKAVVFIGCSGLTFLGGVLLLVGSGIGDASQGIEYTLNSVVAVVLGGAVLSGGRGSFIGVMIGALLLEQAVSLAPFLQLNQALEHLVPGHPPRAGRRRLRALQPRARRAPSGHESSNMSNPAQTTESSSKVWFITGTSSGFGRAWTEAALRARRPGGRHGSQHRRHRRPSR